MQDRVGKTLKPGQKVLYLKLAQFYCADPLQLGEVIEDNTVSFVMANTPIEKVYIQPLHIDAKGKVPKRVWLSNPRHIVIVEEAANIHSAE